MKYIRDPDVKNIFLLKSDLNKTFITSKYLLVYAIKYTMYHWCSKVEKCIVNSYLRNTGSRINVFTPIGFEADIRIIYNAVVFNYDQYLMLESEKFDFYSLHKLIDDLSMRFSTKEYHGNFSYKGVCLLKILEARWVWDAGRKIVFRSIFLNKIASKPVEYCDASGINDYIDVVNIIANNLKIKRTIKFQMFNYLTSAIKKYRYRRYILGLFDTFISGQIDTLITSQRHMCQNHLSHKTKKIIVFCGYNRTAERFKILWPDLVERGYIAHVICLNRVNVEFDQSPSLYVTGVVDWISKSELRLIKYLSRQITANFECVREDVLEIDRVRSENSDDFSDIILPIFCDTIKCGIDSAVLAIEIMNRVISSFSPDLILGFEDWEFNRAANLLGKKYGIPSVGYYCLSPNAMSDLVRRTHDYLIVSGPILKSAFSNQYCDDDLFVVGDALTKKALEVNKININATKRELGVETNKKIVTVLLNATSLENPYHELRLSTQRAFAALDGDTNITIIVKIHPSQSESEAKSWLRLWGCRNYIMIKDCSLIDLFFVSEIVIAPITTAVFQAMIVGVPVVCLQSTKSLEAYEVLDYGYLSGKGIFHIPENIQCKATLFEIINNDQTRELQRKKGYSHVIEHCGYLDSRTGVRFADTLDHILENYNIESK